MKRRRTHTGRNRHGSRRNALAILEKRLNQHDEAAWYAERLERLGQAMFGDLWEPAESDTKHKATSTPHHAQNTSSGFATFSPSDAEKGIKAERLTKS